MKVAEYAELVSAAYSLDLVPRPCYGNSLTSGVGLDVFPMVVAQFYVVHELHSSRVLNLFIMKTSNRLPSMSSCPLRCHLLLKSSSPVLLGASMVSKDAGDLV